MARRQDIAIKLFSRDTGVGQCYRATREAFDMSERSAPANPAGVRANAIASVTPTTERSGTRDQQQR